ncbi:hypothetical protein NDU88_003576 [Pleurodeles waltl]|uniref:Uncharacterized protein n=1 Tax=Pleurodeles waltl TaxID=8319 RepID=A0AAV7VDP5_PLEWA|nr:hypothetical protein NDU88_003576 [Pleurodeles waltl]
MLVRSLCLKTLHVTDYYRGRGCNVHAAAAVYSWPPPCEPHPALAARAAAAAPPSSCPGCRSGRGVKDSRAERCGSTAASGGDWGPACSLGPLAGLKLVDLFSAL